MPVFYDTDTVDPLFYQYLNVLWFYNGWMSLEFNDMKVKLMYNTWAPAVQIVIYFSIFGNTLRGKLSEKLKIGIKILKGQVVLELLIKTCKIVFWSKPAK